MNNTLLIQTNVPLKDKNWFQTGGSAKYFCEPSTTTEFQEALSFAKRSNLAIFLLGEGANVLISDDGFDGLVIRPHTGDIFVHEESDPSHALVTAPAGLSINDFIEKSLTAQLIGLEVFSGIPGTLGGAAYINLHYFQHFFSHFLVSARVIEIESQNVFDVDLDWFRYGYNQSTLVAGKHFVISVTLKLQRATEAETAYARGRRYEIIRHRTSRYPSSHTCGSFFRNFHDDEVSLVSNNKKLIFVAFYLDKVGVKGTEAVGGACVSYQHANMLVNKNNATSSDLVQLACRLQEKVKDQFGITPHPECILVGFKNYPLLDR